jgi:GNAT superfamily N-acetyltransferase
LWRRALGRILAFHATEVVVYRHQCPVSLPSPVEIVEVDEQRLPDVRSMDSDAMIGQFRDFLARGDRGFYGYDGGVVVHRAWVTFGPRAIATWHRFGRIRLAAGHAYVHYCETAPTHRGRGIYSAALSHIVRTLKAERAEPILISTTADHAISRRGIERAGFVEAQRVQVRVAFGLDFSHAAGILP